VVIRVIPWLLIALCILLLVWLMVHLMTTVFLGILPLIVIVAIVRALRR